MEVALKQRSYATDTAVDIAAAFGSAVCVAPLVSLIDMGIIQNASGAKPLKQSIIDSLKELFFRPWVFAQRRSYHLVTGVYFSTYIAANMTETWCSNRKQDPKYPKLVTTSFVNIVAGIAKDSAFTRMFGLKPPSNLPKTTYALFGTRDTLTIWASFTLPPIIARHLHSAGMSEESAINTAQLTLPIGIQLVSTPLHLTGLDLYNNPQHTLAERAAFVRREYLKSAGARMCRIFPAFGIGGVMNRKLRNGLNPDGAPKAYYNVKTTK